MKKLLGLTIAMLVMVLAACSGESASEDTAQSDGDKLTVTTTIGQIADGVKNIGGDKVEVISLMGPGTDPHLYKATQGDIAKLEEADIIFYNGLHLEGKILEVFEKMNADKPTYAIAENVSEGELLEDAEDRSAADPHVWFDIDLWKQALKKVEEGLIEADPDNQAFYKENAQKYYAELDDLKEFAAKEMSSIPEDQRVLVTAHDAFGYFGNAYDMEVMGLQGISTESEYGLGDVQTLVDTLTDREIKAVFVESSISEKSINAVIEGAKDKGHTVMIGGELYSDAMGEEGTEEGTYIGMYRHNVETIADALK
ncbi:metal ABC transporter solute-binding protein, Zn/Mn family [Bacillus mesophilum]|uniref:Manganese transporter n=1 Tax=Bacillus mesophilum TaxID=1071718 RepID=A0A7V7RNK6_9BACI|nr:zinc ABC transporter substrate-binding protein [Bacillus mesophilum]KAB2333607.1 manganese transporter [Bacillus mesophilum]